LHCHKPVFSVRENGELSRERVFKPDVIIFIPQQLPAFPHAPRSAAPKEEKPAGRIHPQPDRAAITDK